MATLGCFFTSYAWQLSDMLPASLFPRQESTAFHEFIKVTEPLSFNVTQQQGVVKVKGWDKESVSIKITQKGTPEMLDNTVVTINKDGLPRELSCIVSRKDDEKSSAQVTIQAYVPFNCNVSVQRRR